jgi:hypothetical protein
MKRVIFLGVALLAMCRTPASASTISLTAPALVSGAFDVVVTARSVFAGRDPLDLVISYGFNVGISNPSILSFLGATSGPLFDSATAQPGTDVFGAASGFGIDSLAVEPITLATLRFNATGAGLASIFISSNAGSVFQGLQFLFDPSPGPIAGTVSVAATSAAAVPEASTFLLFGVGLAGGSGVVRGFRRR